MKPERLDAAIGGQSQTATELRWSRRKFLKAGAVAGLGGPLMLRGATAQARGVSPNGKLNHACIGVGGMGWNDLQNFLQHKRVQVVAVCDVDSINLEKAGKAGAGAGGYADWEGLVGKGGGGIWLGRR